jgi:hypothetical protein
MLLSLSRGTDRRIAADHEHINRQAREISDEAGQTIEAPVGAALFEPEMSSLDIAKVTEPKQKLAAQVGHYRVRWPTWLEVTKMDEFCLLRTSRERPSRRTAKQRHERAPPHGLPSIGRPTHYHPIA